MTVDSSAQAAHTHLWYSYPLNCLHQLFHTLLHLNVCVVIFVCVQLNGLNPVGADNTHVLILFTFHVHTHTLLFTSVIVTVTDQLLNTVHVARVHKLFQSIHHHTIVFIVSLDVTTNSTHPLKHHDATTTLHDGASVSIHFQYITTGFTLHSSSLNKIVHVSSHVILDFGVYVIISQSTVHVHLFHVLTNPLHITFSAPLPHAPSFAFEFILQFVVFGLFHTLLLQVKSFAVIGVFVHLNVTLLHVIFHTLSFTCTFTTFSHTFPLHNEYDVSHQKLLFPFHLYTNGLFPHPSSVATIFAVHVVHSGTSSTVNDVTVGFI
jgi:hypothetical protein